MRNATVSLFVFAAAMGLAASADAQQALSVDVIESYGAYDVQRNGVGCFDVLAAMRLQSEALEGAFSEETRRAFASGSCIVAASTVSLGNAQKISIEDAHLVRGMEPNSSVTLYFPEALMNGEIGTADISPLAAIATDLRERVDLWQRCVEDRDELDARIIEFNARVDAYLAEQSEETVETGSRLKGNDSAAVASVRLSSLESRELRDESNALKAEAAALETRCAAHRDSLVLDQDYLPFIRATGAARS